MTTQIKNLFKLKPAPEVKIEENNVEVSEENEEVRKRTYHEAGFRDGSRNVGNPKALSVCLDAIYAKFQNEEKELQEKQLKIKEPYINEQKNKESKQPLLVVR